MATIAGLVRIFDTRVWSPAQIVAAAHRQGRRIAASRCGISDLNSSTLAAMQNIPAAERLSAATSPRRNLASQTSTRAPAANSKIRNGIRKNTASGSVLAATIENRNEATAAIAMT